MTVQTSAETAAPRWLHGWALLTLAAALPLLFLGAEVTTMGVGMVDAHGLRSPWYFFQEFLNERGLDWKIEHGHRQAGWIIGNCVIVLVVLVWWREPRRWVRWLSLAVLAAVCGQGLLGIFRIELNAMLGKTLALIHGCFAQLVFAMLAVMAVVTSRSWQRAPAMKADAPFLRRWALLTLFLTYGQLILGGLVRHQDFALVARAHVLGAFAVVAAVVWLAKQVLESEQRDALGRWLKALVFLVGIQIILGVETWLNKFFVPQSSWNQLQPLALNQEFIRSIHYVAGTLLFATTAGLTLNVYRLTNGATSTKAAPHSLHRHPAEGTA